jgi:hypothetical protein
MTNNRKPVTRREFIQTTSLAAGLLGSTGAIRAAAPAADIRIGLYSITYGGVWYRGEALTTEQVIQHAKKFGYQGVEIDGKRPNGGHRLCGQERTIGARIPARHHRRG